MEPVRLTAMLYEPRCVQARSRSMRSAYRPPLDAAQMSIGARARAHMTCRRDERRLSARVAIRQAATTSAVTVNQMRGMRINNTMSRIRIVVTGDRVSG